MTGCPAVDELPCSRRLNHSGDHCDVVGHWWPQAEGEPRARAGVFSGWPADAPDVYVDADGEHGWDDIVEDEDGDPDDPMTYRELAYDLAAAHGLSVAEFLSRQHMRHGSDEKMSPPWVDDED